MDVQHVQLLVYWVLFCALHSLLASLRWKGLMQNVLGSGFRLYRLYYTLFAFISLGFVLYWQITTPSPLLFTRNILSVSAGSLILLLGIIIMTICIRKYFMHLSGLKSLYLNDEQAANELQVTGIHRYVRHPLYSGTFLAIWGLWVLMPRLSLLLANLVITGYTLLAIRWEEEKLIAEFGDSYRLYKKKVPKLLPMRGKSLQNSY